MRMLGLPIQLIGGAISTVFQQKATHDYNSAGTCRPIFIKTLKTLSLIAIVPTLIIMFYGPDLFALIFGEKWRDAGIYARILISMIMLKMVVSPLTYTFFIAGKLREDFIYHIGVLITSTFSLYFGLRYFDIYFTLIIFSGSYIFWYLIYLFKSYKFAGDV